MTRNQMELKDDSMKGGSETTVMFSQEFLESDFRQWIQERVNNRLKYKLQHIRAKIKEGKYIYI